MKRLAAVILIIGVSACGGATFTPDLFDERIDSGIIDPPPDATPDAARDVVDVDADAAAVADGSEGGVTDAGADSGEVDGSLDGGADASDAALDAGADTGVDAPDDAPVDTGVDAPVDAPPDVVDAAVDAGVDACVTPPAFACDGTGGNFTVTPLGQYCIKVKNNGSAQPEATPSACASCGDYSCACVLANFNGGCGVNFCDDTGGRVTVTCN